MLLVRPLLMGPTVCARPRMLASPLATAGAVGCITLLTPYFADIGITTNTTSNLSSTSVVLTLVAGRRDSAPTVSNKRHGCYLSSFQSAIMFFMTVIVASEVRFNASRSLTQPCLTVLCSRCSFSMIQAFYQALQIHVSLRRCI